MTQPSLLDLPPARTKTRRHVPESSRLTYQAEHARLTGRAASVRTWLRNWPFIAPTSAELSRWVFGDNETPVVDALYVRRGLSDLKTAGIAEHAGMRRCRVSGRACQTWRLRTR